jgi:hypothetical protein
MWGSEPSHSQGYSHFGRGSPCGLPKLQRAIWGVKTQWLVAFFVSLELRCLKWARIAHLDIWNTSYGQKKGRESKPGVRLPIWLLTRKSRESTRFTWLQATCHISLESSRQELQLCFRPRCDPRSARKVTWLQSCESLGWRSFGTPMRESRESRDKKAILMWAPWRGAEYTTGSKVVAYSRGPGRGESCVKVPVACPQHPRVSRNVN